MTDVTQPMLVAPRFAGRQPVLEWAAVALGALTFIWGFLDWFGTDGVGQNGYRLTDGYLPIGLALIAALFAVINLRPDRTERTAWLGIGLSGLAVLFTIVAMAVKPTIIQAAEEAASAQGESVSLSIQVGLILTLVSTALQLACLVAGWLFASGRLTVAGLRSRSVPPPVTAPPAAPEPPAPHSRHQWPSDPNAT